MEIPIQVACRICPTGFSNSPIYIRSIPAAPILLQPDVICHPPQAATTGIIQVGTQSFPVTHALPLYCTQDYVYHQTVYPTLAIFLEGFDASFVAYGQSGTGKTYTLLGPGFNCVISERDHGIIQRCVRDVFAKMVQQQERSYVISIAWVEIVGDEIHDLLDAGTILCMSVGDVFHWLKVGMNNKNRVDHIGHSLFTLTLEQQWINTDGLIQHRLSTLSFCDLCATDRISVMNSIDQNQPISVPKDLGLQALESVVHALTDPNCLIVDYNQSKLTTMLKDSFGGRAQTLFILCVSQFEEHANETQQNLQFAFKTQCVRNFVVLNTFSDNNTMTQVVNETTEQPDTFGLQFAASQWLKLVANAEGLFSKLIVSKSLSEQDRERIEEWMFLKQECEECLSSGEINMANQRHLGPIQEETDEQDETSDQETSCVANTDPDSDSESQHPDLDEKADNFMEEFQYKTNNLVEQNYDGFVQAHPKAILDSNDSFRNFHDEKQCKDESRSPSPPNYDRRKSSTSRCERRKSIPPGLLSLSSIELALLNRVASRQEITNDEYLSKATDIYLDPKTRHNPLEVIHKQLRKVDTDLEAHHREITELKNTISLKKGLISDLNKTTDARATAKQRLNKQKTKAESEYEKCKKQLQKAVAGGGDKEIIEKLKLKTSHLEERLKNIESAIYVASESGQSIKQHKKSLKISQKQLEELDEVFKRNKKLKDSLENKLKNEKSKTNKNRGIEPIEHSVVPSKTHKDFKARISHVDHVLKQKSDHLQKFVDSERGALRHEIRNLRSTKNQIQEERYSLDQKFKKEKSLSHRDERKLLECEEAIEAIDAAMEFKNELICGRKSVDTDESLQREKGEQMLMARLNKLSNEELRTLLYKYFQKVVDLRDSSLKLEHQLIALERERDAWEWRERALNNAIRQARLEGESHAVFLQQQQEAKVALMLRHLADETSTSSSVTDRYNDHHQHRSNHYGNTDDSAAGCGLGLDVYKPPIHYKQLIKSKATNMDLCSIPVDGRPYKYRPLDKMKEKDREGKNKFLAKIQEFTRYHGGIGLDKRKVQDSSMSIPEQNLKQLLFGQEPMTKVTRGKNKIIIQQGGRHSGHRQ